MSELRFNRGTGPDGMKCEKILAFRTPLLRDREFRIGLVMPIEVRDKLKQENWNRAIDLVRTRAEELLRDAALAGLLGDDAFAVIHELVAQYARNVVYQEYSNGRHAAGDEAWEVPPTLQNVPVLG